MTIVSPGGPGDIDVDKVLDEVAARLSDRFTGVFSPETVQRCVDESYYDLSRTARIQRHLPALTENFAVERLTALAQTRGAITKPVPEILLAVHEAADRRRAVRSRRDRHHGLR